jgi:endonuclease/exonuclease/phosphatase family metal-dependent hydrolase
MPFYYKLRITESHSAASIAKNRRIARNLLRLREALRLHLGIEDLSKDIGEITVRDNSQFLRLATWNIREFDSNTYGKRLDESFYYIAEIISHFDLVAVQEVREDRQALDAVMDILGPGWRYIATDVTEGDPGNRERMVFIYNSHKVLFCQVAGEVILPKDNLDEMVLFKNGVKIELPEGKPLVLREDVRTYTHSGKEKLDEEVLISVPENTKLVLPAGTNLIIPKRTEIARTAENQVFVPAEDGYKDILLTLPNNVFKVEDLNFARTPFLVSFQAGWLKLNLCTVHIYYGTGELGMRRRKAEINRLIDFLAERAKSDSDSDANNFFIALGDFNIVDREHETMKALVRHGFKVPAALQRLPGSNVEKDKYYDQIAYWSDPREAERPPRTVVKVDVLRAGVFDFFETVFRYFDEPEADGTEAEQVDLEEYIENVSAFRREVEEALEKKAQKVGRPLTAAEEKEEKRKKYRDWRTYQMSDHLPMWIELRIDFGDDYLESIVQLLQGGE